MRTVHSLDELQRARPTVLTIGAFDGVHRGHQWLIRQVVNRARALDYDAMVLSFDPRPEVTLRPGALQLTDARDKARLMADLGPDVLAILPFTMETAAIPASEFLLSLLEHVNVGEMWVGADFAFGHKRSGTVQFLIESGAAVGFAVHVVPRQKLIDIPLSSSRARELISACEMREAAEVLGHWYGFSGPVVRGHGRGRAMGYPTANVQPPAHQLVPGTGIYAGYLSRAGESLPAAISVGYNPTFDDNALSVEAFVLDWDGDLYDQIVGIDFVEKVRDERKFESKDALIAEMGRDVERVREVLAVAEQPGELLSLS